MIRGRGTSDNPANRYHQRHSDPFDDGWDSLENADASVATELFRDSSRTVISYNSSPDVPFDRSINPYRGCEHGCSYCFARPTHAWLDCSPGIDFETQIFYKPETAALLADELAHPEYRCRPVALGVNTDAWQPAERRLGISRQVLQVLESSNHPVSIITKSALVERDLDLLTAMARRQLVHVMVSVTTLDRQLARRMEPRAAAPQRRLQTISALSEAGVPVGVLVAPVIPVLNDAEIECILESVREAGALTAGYVLLRLPHEVGDIFTNWLHAHYPLKARHVLERVRDCRGGSLYDASFGQRMRGSGVFADLIAARFRHAYARCGFPGLPEFDTSRFSPPRGNDPQLDLFRGL